MRVLVIDDEAPARRRLIRMLERIAGVTIVGEARDGIEGLEEIRARRPSLVLLDIDMPGLDGLALAAEPELPPLIFVTAHAEHALRAFEVAAFDYLLKPVSQERLVAALDRVRARETDPRAPAEGAAPPTQEDARRAKPDAIPRIGARAGNTTYVFDAREIDRFTAEDKYTIFWHQGREHMLDDSLSALEERLAEHEFFRVHRRDLVNLRRVVALHQQDGAVVVELIGGVRVPVSRRQIAELRRRLAR